MSVSSLFRYLNIKVSVVHEQTLINYVRLSSETDKSNFSYQILNHRLFIERWACSYRPQALRRTKRSSGDLHNKAWVLLIKSQSSTASNSFSLHCLKWKWVFPVVLAVVFYFIFCSVPGLLHASLCPILAVTFWKTLVIDAFHFHDQRDPYHELMDESSWRNIYIYPLPDQIFSSTQIQSRIQIPALQLVLSNPQQWMIYEKTKGEDFYRKFTCWSMLLLNSCCCHMRLYHISKEFLQHFIFGWVLMAL